MIKLPAATFAADDQSFQDGQLSPLVPSATPSFPRTQPDATYCPASRTQSETRTSMFSARTYQPQEWLGRGTGSAGHMPFRSPPSRRHTMFPLQLSGHEDLLPSPPPPYVSPSPRRSQLSTRHPAGPSARSSAHDAQNLSTPITGRFDHPLEQTQDDIPSVPGSRRSQSASNIDRNDPSLLPPPPGPPPMSVRAVSVDAGATSYNRATRPARLGAAEAPLLSPVPHTPMSWLRDSPSSINGDNPAQHHSPTPLASIDRPIALARRPVRRKADAEAIRDRRSRSRAARGSLVLAEAWSGGSESPDISRPADLILSSTRLQHCTAAGSQQRLKGSGAPGEPLTSARGPISGNTLSAPITGSPAMTRLSSAGIFSPLMTSNSRQTSKSTPNTIYTGSVMPSPFDPLHAEDDLTRFLHFSDEEARAGTDEARLQLFASFMVQESIIRRARYAEAFGGISAALYATLDDIWGDSDSPFDQTDEEATASANIRTAEVERGSLNSPRLDDAASGAGRSATPTDSSAPATSSLMQDQMLVNMSPWNDHYRTDLSPIESSDEAAGDGLFEERGRTASAWWDSDTGSPQERTSDQRWTQQESKRMSVLPSIEKSLQPRLTHCKDDIPIAASNTFAKPPDMAVGNGCSVTTTSPDTPLALVRLDISRLITLPPTYPRHYPAILNCHPQLEEKRQQYTSIADMTGCDLVRSGYDNQEQLIVDELRAAALDRRRAFDQGVRNDLNGGRIDQRIAAEAARRFQHHELQLTIRNAREAYARYNARCFQPLFDQLQQKAEAADRLIPELEAMLVPNAMTFSGDDVQVGGDEEPELFEKLRLLKWLVDAREQVHSQLTSLALQKEVKHRVCNQASAIDNIEGVEDTGYVDMQGLEVDAAIQSTARLKKFNDIIRQHVTAGVQGHASAFWDIAPQLSAVIEQIPITVASMASCSHDRWSYFTVTVPPEELLDNPALSQHPLQCLFTSLSHAKNSTRQFIDSQINLLCLQHEVQIATLKANVSLNKLLHGNDGNTARSEDCWQSEEDLTTALQAQVQEIEQSWDQALGTSLTAAMCSVRTRLQHTGGWDDSLLE